MIDNIFIKISLLVGVLFLCSSVCWAGWYQDTAHSNWVWLYRQKITVNSSKVSNEVMTDFPVLVNITTAGNPLFSHIGKTNGDDVVFTQANGTSKMTHEVDYINTTTGTFCAWVRVPSLSNTVNTDIYMYYGCAAAASQENVAATWPGVYLGVWHIAEGGKTANRLDSTGTGATAFPINYNNSGGVNGQIGLADNMITTETAYLSVEVNNATFNLATGESMTVSCWLKPANFFVAWQAIVTKGNNDWRLARNNATSGASFGFGPTSNEVTVRTTLLDGNWHYLVATCAHLATATATSIYLDGALENAHNFPVFGMSDNFPVQLGNNSSVTGRQYSGRLDEVRFAKVIRDKFWISTEYNNQNSPGTFYTLAAEERHPFAMIVQKPDRRRGRDYFL